jgi:hypothetical protein
VWGGGLTKNRHDAAFHGRECPVSCHLCVCATHNATSPAISKPNCRPRHPTNAILHRAVPQHLRHPAAPTPAGGVHPLAGAGHGAPPLRRGPVQPCGPGSDQDTRLPWHVHVPGAAGRGGARHHCGPNPARRGGHHPLGVSGTSQQVRGHGCGGLWESRRRVPAFSPLLPLRPSHYIPVGNLGPRFETERRSQLETSLRLLQAMSAAK